MVIAGWAVEQQTAPDSDKQAERGARRSVTVTRLRWIHTTQLLFLQTHKALIGPLEPESAACCSSLSPSLASVSPLQVCEGQH